MLISHYVFTYGKDDLVRYNASDPKEWTVTVKSAIFPYEEIEIEH
jgi:hypothetical protein